MTGALAVLWALARTPTGATILAVLAAIAGFAWWTDRAERKGAAGAQARIEEKQRRVLDEARAGIDDVRACERTGGVWSLADGRCRDGVRRDGP